MTGSLHPDGVWEGGGWSNGEVCAKFDSEMFSTRNIEEKSVVRRSDPSGEKVRSS